MKRKRIPAVVLIASVFCVCACAWGQAGARIKISDSNSRYFEYGGKEIFLNGAGPWEPYSKTSIDYEYWHDQLVAHKGNSIRTLVCWPAGYGNDLPAWEKNGSGKFDLDTFNDAFWQRFDNVLNDATSKGIFTLLQVWDECQIEYPGNPNRWGASPWNPDNNINYTSTDMPTNIPGFYDSLPALEDRPAVFNLQKKYMDKILETTAPYAHRIIFILGNEYSYSGEGSSSSHQGPWEEWPTYWRDYIKDYDPDLVVANNVINATRAQYVQYFTDCRMDAMCMMQDPEHFDGVYSDIAGDPRPLFFSKNPGSSALDPATDSVWTYFCKGAAGSRFHMYEGPLLLDAIVRNEYLVDVAECIPLAQMAPHQDLIDSPNGEYCLAQPGRYYVVYCSTTSDGNVTVNLSDTGGELGCEWHNTRTGEILSGGTVTGGGWVGFTAPNSDPWTLLITLEHLWGDLDEDGFVGADDLDIVLAEWGDSVTPGSTPDPSGDGSVGQADLDIVLNDWGQSTQPIPEPLCLVMLLAGGIGLTRRRVATHRPC